MDFKKAYEDALERAKCIYNENPSSSTAKFVCGQIFPEIKESEDERIRKEIINYLSNELHNVKQLTPRTNEFEDWIAYLEREKEQQPAEWSEEDEECRKELIQYIEQRIGDGTTGQSLWRKWHSWLKSLPERFNLQPKQEWSEEDEIPSWKPSEEQMQGLRRGIVKADEGSDAKNAMVSLYDDLKKLI